MPVNLAITFAQVEAGKTSKILPNETPLINCDK